MNVDSILISEYAATDATGRLTVVNVFNQILGKGAPPWGRPFFSISLVIHGHSREAGTKHSGELFLLDSSRNPVTEQPWPFEFAFPKKITTPGLPLRYIQTLTILGAAFQEPGVYVFEVHIDGTYHASASLYVGKAKKG